MRDQGLILSGLIVFLGMATYPFSYNLATRKTPRAPQLTLPTEAKECVAPVQYMNQSHMKLLSSWRDSVVRMNIRTYAASDGKIYDASLSRTCLAKCHIRKTEFCDRCHTYLGVRSPDCMACHVDPLLIKRSDE